MHRDIKLENIMMTFEQFNISKELEEKGLKKSLEELLKSKKEPLFKFIKQNAERWKNSPTFFLRDLENKTKFVSTVLKSRVKLIDFGFSRVIEPDIVLSTFVGNINSMSREVLKRNYDYSSEIWSIGIITYHLLQGEPPFLSNSVTELDKKLDEGTYTFYKKYQPTEEIVDFIQMLLQADIKERPNFKQIFEHPFLSKSSAEFKGLEFNDSIQLSIYDKKEFLKKEELKQEFAKSDQAGITNSGIDEDSFIIENYLDIMYQNQLFECEKFEENMFINYNYYN
jgi:serine/threonine protein kinase